MTAKHKLFLSATRTNVWMFMYYSECSSFKPCYRNPIRLTSVFPFCHLNDSIHNFKDEILLSQSHFLYNIEHATETIDCIGTTMSSITTRHINDKITRTPFILFFLLAYFFRSGVYGSLGTSKRKILKSQSRKH